MDILNLAVLYCRKDLAGYDAQVQEKPGRERRAATAACPGALTMVAGSPTGEAARLFFFVVGLY